MKYQMCFRLSNLPTLQVRANLFSFFFFFFFFAVIGSHLISCLISENKKSIKVFYMFMK